MSYRPTQDAINTSAMILSELQTSRTRSLGMRQTRFHAQVGTALRYICQSSATRNTSNRLRKLTRTPRTGKSYTAAVIGSRTLAVQFSREPFLIPKTVQEMMSTTKWRNMSRLSTDVLPPIRSRVYARLFASKDSRHRR